MPSVNLLTMVTENIQILYMCYCALCLMSPAFAIKRSHWTSGTRCRSSRLRNTQVAHFQGVKLSSRNLETSVQLTDVTLLLVKGEIFTSDIPQGDDVQVIMPYIFPKIPDEVPNYRLI